MSRYDPAPWSGVVPVLRRCSTTRRTGRNRAAPRWVTGGRSLLELGVGTGRLAIPLHDAGWRVVGVDASGEMIEELRRKAGDRSIEVHRGDMRTVRLDDRFDVALLAFSTLYLLPDQEAQVDCLVNATQHLAPGGLVVIEAFVPDHTRWDHGKRLALSRWDADAVEIEAARHDRSTQAIEVQYIALGPGGIRLRPLRLRYAWPAEIDLMARIAGLHLVGMGGLERGTLRLSSGGTSPSTR